MDLTTTSFVLNLTLFSIGVWILIKGSDGVIEGATTIARHFAIPELIIGLTLVSIGTSLPELATNVYAAIVDEGSVAIGNVVGSNITNVLLVAGIAATGLGIIPINKTTFQRDAMTMIGVYGLFSLFCYIGSSPSYRLSRPEGSVLFFCCIGYILYLLNCKHDNLEASSQIIGIQKNKKLVVRAFFKAFISCFWVVLGAKLIVDNVIWAANRLAIPQELVSATVIALGTSLPEVAVTVSGIVKNKREIALGNIIGSNIFNILLIMGVTACIRPVPVSDDVRCFLIPYMLVTGFGFAVFMRTSWALVRWEGLCFLTGYVLFIGWNLLTMKS